jgi:hypothetical protein
MTSIEDTINKLFLVIDSIVELYLGKVIKPFLTLHETFYTALNTVLRQILDDNRSTIPTWFTANFITYGRTVLVIPTILLLAWDYTILPSMIVLLVDFGDFLDGVVARFWVDRRKDALRDEGLFNGKNKTTSTSPPSSSDDDSFGTWYILVVLGVVVVMICPQVSFYSSTSSSSSIPQQPSLHCCCCCCCWSTTAAEKWL